jgi:Cu(I)/Ag(I) efflux system membrane protein CusA/SilA
MIELIIEWSIRNRVIVILAAIAVGIAGVRALMTMPVDAIPDLSENQVIVFTDWMGRSPQEIEDQVTYPLSVNLQGLAGVKVVRSSSEFNFSMINIIFDDATDYYFARQRVLERLSIASTFLPQGVTPYLAPDATALGQIYWYTLEGEGRDLGELRAIQDWFVRYQLNSVPGVAEVASVGGAPREYQIDLDPNKLRAYGLSLGSIYGAVQRSNSSVGGRVVHKGNAEYLIRSVGWIRDARDIENTVVAERNGTPITIGQVATVQLGPGFRRSVLEKDGREVVGGVVLMRYGENPLEVTRRVKAKIESLEVGLPEGVRIVPFYDRTPLIRKALATVSDTVKEELFICTMMILIVMGHLGGAFVVSLTLPLAVLFSFLLMRLTGVPSNIMSLAGIAISVGILEDQAVVMTENAAHHLTRRFGNRRVTGDNLDLIIPACRTVGRPIFFSILITILSFLPVFALSGMEGKMFHPLAWTKTFALVGVAVLSITLVPALIPICLRGRIKGEEDSWLVRTMIAIFRPMLAWLMDRPTLVCWMFACILGLGFVASQRLGREFMPALDEGSILDMPTSVPRMSVTQATTDLKARDAMIRGFPEVTSVVGKAGRAETATDPSPLDMIETVINLRDRDEWTKRHLRFDDVVREVRLVADALVKSGSLPSGVSDDKRQSLINSASMTVAAQVDAELRTLARSQIDAQAPGLGRALIDRAITSLVERIEPRSNIRKPTKADRRAVIEALAPTYGARLALDPSRNDVRPMVEAMAERLAAAGILRPGTAGLSLRQDMIERLRATGTQAVGLDVPDLFDRITSDLAAEHASQEKAHIQSLNWELFDRAVALVPTAAIAAIEVETQREGLAWKPVDAAALAGTLKPGVYDRLFLWRKTKDQLVSEMDTTIQVPGWGNIWTQPIINRINMLATGVRTDVGIKVFGSDLDTIQRVSREIAAAVRPIRGAVDVVPDQVVGKGYVEIQIDRERAARYGINVSDVQDVVEVAMGGSPITQTVEGRERFPVRIRYARDFRTDEEALRQILVSGGTGSGDSQGATGMGMAADTPAALGTRPVQVTLGMVADVSVMEGPSMIKSENGLLRSYVQLNVRDRDLVGFVEEAQKVVASKVKLPEGIYLEWAGEFEHQARARRTLQVMFPAVLSIIVGLLYLTYRSWTDVLLMMTSVLGALAGGAIFQWVFGYRFSVAVWVGYIACFGMAVETGVVMLVYLREAIAERGGLERIESVAELREAILQGAIHRLRPKLLTEGTTIIAIAPMLWADGVGAEVIRPMAAPVLGGLLIADEVIDIFLPVLYLTVNRWKWRRLHGLRATDEVRETVAVG